MVAALKPLLGLRLQEVQTSEHDVVLGFYSSEGLLWLWIDLNAIQPSLLPWSELPLNVATRKIPLHLFLKANFVGRALDEIAVSKEQGRVVEFKFSDRAALEVRLIPHLRNVIASAGGKKIAWQKPTALPALDAQPQGVPRTLEQLRQDWLQQRQSKKGQRDKPVDPLARLRIDLSKKQKALEKVREELKNKEDLPWKKVGAWLKANQSLDVPAEWRPFVDQRRKLAWNIEQCFAKAREVDGKVTGTKARFAALENEILILEQRLSTGGKAPTVPVKAKINLKVTGAQARTLHLDEGLTVMAGKSAADNLKILRKARAWDLWFHLRDYPSSHAILFRNKNAKVNDQVLLKVAAWFVRNHLGEKAAQHIGEKFELIVTECRFVNPIKGDKIGRVTYRDERTLIFKLP